MQNFHDFLNLKYNNFRTIGPIRMIFFANCWQFYPLSKLKKKSLNFLKKFRNICENVVFDQKTAKLATLQNRLHKFKNDCQIRHQCPKIREVRYFLGFDILFVDQCNNVTSLLSRGKPTLMNHLYSWLRLIFVGDFYILKYYFTSV